mgnify:CR=1 FL=1
MLKKPELIFLIIGFIFGIIMVFLVPQYAVPDEEAHYARAIEISKGYFYNNPKSENITWHGASGYAPILYTASGLGVKLTKNFGEDIQFYSGRICNLLVWLFLIYLAIAITPVFKWLFMITALLPMSLYEGMSYAADSFNNAFVFLFFAYIFKLIYEKECLRWQDYVILSIFSIISAFVKGALYPIFLFFFLPIKKHKYLFPCLILILSFSLLFYWSSINYTAYSPDSVPEYHRYILFHEPIKFLYSCTCDIVMHTEFYIKSCIGVLGLLTIYMKPCYYLVLLTSLMYFFIFPEEKIKNSHRICALTCFIIFSLFMFAMFYIVWTPIQAKTICGVQGRYFLPFLPLLFIVFAQSKSYLGVKFQNPFKIYLILNTSVCLAFSCYMILKYYYLL